MGVVVAVFSEEDEEIDVEEVLEEAAIGVG